MARIENAHKFEKMESPSTFYDQIKHIESKMEDYIHDLVWQYGKKINKRGDYKISFGKRSPCIITMENGRNVRLKDVVIYQPKNCQVRGHLVFHTLDGETLSFIDVWHQEFNVYSVVHRKVEKIKEKIKNK